MEMFLVLFFFVFFQKCSCEEEWTFSAKTLFSKHDNIIDTLQYIKPNEDFTVFISFDHCFDGVKYFPGYHGSLAFMDIYSDFECQNFLDRRFLYSWDMFSFFLQGRGYKKKAKILSNVVGTSNLETEYYHDAYFQDERSCQNALSSHFGTNEGLVSIVLNVGKLKECYPVKEKLGRLFNFFDWPSSGVIFRKDDSYNLDDLKHRFFSYEVQTNPSSDNDLLEKSCSIIYFVEHDDEELKCEKSLFNESVYHFKFSYTDSSAKRIQNLTSGEGILLNTKSDGYLIRSNYYESSDDASEEFCIGSFTSKLGSRYYSSFYTCERSHSKCDWEKCNFDNYQYMFTFNSDVRRAWRTADGFYDHIVERNMGGYVEWNENCPKIQDGEIALVGFNFDVGGTISLNDIWGARIISGFEPIQTPIARSVLGDNGINDYEISASSSYSSMNGLYTLDYSFHVNSNYEIEYDDIPKDVGGEIFIVIGKELIDSKNRIKLIFGEQNMCLQFNALLFALVIILPLIFFPCCFIPLFLLLLLLLIPAFLVFLITSSFSCCIFIVPQFLCFLTFTYIRLIVNDEVYVIYDEVHDEINGDVFLPLRNTLHFYLIMTPVGIVCTSLFIFCNTIGLIPCCIVIGMIVILFVLAILTSIPFSAVFIFPLLVFLLFCMFCASTSIILLLSICFLYCMSFCFTCCRKRMKNMVDKEELIPIFLFQRPCPYEIAKKSVNCTINLRTESHMRAQKRPYIIPMSRICPYCEYTCRRKMSGCKHSKCGGCELWFCHICLRVPEIRTSGDCYSEEVRWGCGNGTANAYRVCPPNENSTSNNEMVFPKQTRENRDRWFVGRDLDHYY